MSNEISDNTENLSIESVESSSSGSVSPADFKNITDKVNIVQFGFLFLLATLFFALGAIWTDYLANKQATYSDLRDKVEEQNRILNNFIEDYKEDNAVEITDSEPITELPE